MTHHEEVYVAAACQWNLWRYVIRRSLKTLHNYYLQFYTLIAGSYILIKYRND